MGCTLHSLIISHHVAHKDLVILDVRWLEHMSFTICFGCNRWIYSPVAVVQTHLTMELLAHKEQRSNRNLGSSLWRFYFYVLSLISLLLSTDRVTVLYKG